MRRNVFWMTLLFAACAGSASAPPSSPTPSPVAAAAVADTAAPAAAPETQVDDAETSLVRGHAASALSVAPDALTVRRTSSRGISAWRAYVDGQTRGPGRRLTTAVVSGDDVFMGQAGFNAWHTANGHTDPIATAIAYHVLVQASDSEPYGSWSRGRRQRDDPAFSDDGTLAFYHADPRRGQLMRTTLTFASDGSVTAETISR